MSVCTSVCLSVCLSDATSPTNPTSAGTIGVDAGVRGGLVATAPAGKDEWPLLVREEESVDASVSCCAGQCV